jgi:hypothetical protein
VLTKPILASETFGKGEKEEKKTKRQKRDQERYSKKQHTKAEVRFRELLDKRQDSTVMAHETIVYDVEPIFGLKYKKPPQRLAGGASSNAEHRQVCDGSF